MVGDMERMSAENDFVGPPDKDVDMKIHIHGKSRSGIRIDMVTTIDDHQETDGEDASDLLQAYEGLAEFFQNAILIMLGVLTVDEHDHLVPRDYLVPRD